LYAVLRSYREKNLEQTIFNYTVVTYQEAGLLEWKINHATPLF